MILILCGDDSVWDYIYVCAYVYICVCVCDVLFVCHKIATDTYSVMLYIYIQYKMKHSYWYEISCKR